MSEQTGRKLTVDPSSRSEVILDEHGLDHVRWPREPGEEVRRIMKV